ncbi:MAG: hypothetical protein IIU67_03035 [Lachnospiraceae bacterium]|nr:hypothetical protein [Lachnospiraceae bacterium]
MKDRKFSKYLFAGVTAVTVIAVSILLVFLFLERQAVSSFFDKIMEILSPIIIGAVLAFLVSPVYNSFYKKTVDLLATAPEKEEKAKSLARLHGTVVSVIFLVSPCPYSTRRFRRLACRLHHAEQHHRAMRGDSASSRPPYYGC